MIKHRRPRTSGPQRSGRQRRRKGPAPSSERDLILRTTETICEAMKNRRVSKAELARRMGKSNAYVTQILSGERNLTLRTISTVASALELIPRVKLFEKDSGDGRQPLLKDSGEGGGRS